MDREGIPDGRPCISKAPEVGLGVASSPSKGFCDGEGRWAGPRRQTKESGEEVSLGEASGSAGSCETPLFSPGWEKPPRRAIAKLLWASFKGCVLDSLGRAGRPTGAGTSCSLGSFSGGTQTCRAPGPERRPSPPRSCEAGRRSSGPSSGRASAGRAGPVPLSTD